MKKHISILSLFLISLSSMIGSGWLFGALYSAHYAGPAAILAWPIAGILLILLALTYAEVATMYPSSDNLTILPLYSHGRLTSVMLSVLAWISLATMPVIETQGLIQYASNYIPGLMSQVGTAYVSTFSGYIAALFILLSFVFFNYFGVRFFAKINTGFTIWKVIIPILTLITLFQVSYQPKDFTQYGGFMPYGWKGVMMAMSSGGALFSLLGFRQIVVMMGAVKNPGKYIPVVLVGSIALTALLYTFLQWAFIGSMNEQDLANGWSQLTFKGDAGPFAALAALAGVIWLSLLLYVDAFVSPYGTALVFSTTSAHMLKSMGDVKNAPQIVSTKNKYHAPWVSLLINFMLSALMFFVLKNWQAMAAFIVAVQIVSYSIGPISLATLRITQRDFPRVFKLPCGYVVSFLAFCVCTVGAYWCGWGSIHKLLWLCFSGLGIYIVYYYIQSRSFNGLYFKNSIWFLLYLLGIGIFSYYGNYGGLEVIPLYWDLVYLILFSLLIFVMALVQRKI